MCCFIFDRLFYGVVFGFVVVCVLRSVDVRVGGRVFKGEVVDEGVVEVIAGLDELEGVGIGDIPEFVGVLVVAYRGSTERGDVFAELFGEIVVWGDGTVYVMYDENSKYYRGYMPVEEYIWLVGELARKVGFRKLGDIDDDVCVGVELEIKVDPGVVDRGDG